MKKFLVFDGDRLGGSTTRVVVAEGADAALKKYMQVVTSRESVFREHVLDLAVNMSFVERFHLYSDQEKERFTESGEAGTEELIIKSRVKQFFANAPDIGERFLEYMETEDPSLLDDTVFEFIAMNDIVWRDSFKAVDIDSIEVVI